MFHYLVLTYLVAAKPYLLIQRFTLKGSRKIKEKNQHQFQNLLCRIDYKEASEFLQKLGDDFHKDLVSLNFVLLRSAKERAMLAPQ